MSAVWKLVNLEKESSPAATTHLQCSRCTEWQQKHSKVKQQVRSSNTYKDTEAANTQNYANYKREYPRDSDMVRNITENVTELIALDNQLISAVDDQGFLRHLEFLNARYALQSQHYITIYSTFGLRHAGMRTSFVGFTQQSMKNRQPRRC